MARKQKRRKTRVTKKEVKEIREAKKQDRIKAGRRSVSPGPWTEIETDLEVKAKLRLNEGIIGGCLGTYPKDRPDGIERGWYPIIFNITSKSIKRDVAEHGLDHYLAACEKSLNSPENRKQYGMIIILQASSDNSQHPDRNRRFISCRGKTDKYKIKGFSAIRNRKYIVL